MTAPKIPRVNTLVAAALALMLRGEKITHLHFQYGTRSYCLRHPIYLLRRADWPIMDEPRLGGISPYSGRETRYKAYFINPKDVTYLKGELGAELDKFIAAVKELERRIADEH